MEVLVKKSNKENWTTIVKCTGEGNKTDNGRRGTFACGSVLKVNAEDLFLTLSGGSYCEEGSIENYTCKCPECGSYTDLKEAKIPADIKAYLSNKYYQEKRENKRERNEERTVIVEAELQK